MITFSLFGKKLREKNKEVKLIRDKYFSNLEQDLFRLKEIRSLGIMKYIFDSFSSLSVDLKHKNISMGLLNNISQGIAQSINFLLQIAVMGLGSYLFYRGNITLQNFIAFTSYSNQFSSSLLGVTNINSNIQQIMASLERIFNILDGLKDDSKKFGNNEIENVKGNIEFKKSVFQILG